MVDYLQTAFYCIELDTEQGVTVSKMLSYDLFFLMIVISFVK